MTPEERRKLKRYWQLFDLSMSLSVQAAQTDDDEYFHRVMELQEKVTERLDKISDKIDLEMTTQL